MENMENKEEIVKSPDACETKTDGKRCCGRFCGHRHLIIVRIFVKLLIVIIIFSVGMCVGVKMGRHASNFSEKSFRGQNSSRHFNSNRGVRTQSNMMFRGPQTQQNQIIPQANQPINQGGNMMRLQLPTGQINVQIPANQVRQ